MCLTFTNARLKGSADLTAIAFLGTNNYDLNMTEDEAYALVMRVAQGEMNKEEVSVFIQKHIQAK